MRLGSTVYAEWSVLMAVLGFPCRTDSGKGFTGNLIQTAQQRLTFILYLGWQKLKHIFQYCLSLSHTDRLYISNLDTKLFKAII